MHQRVLQTAPNIFLAQVDEDYIVLDLAGDRYDCLFSAASSITLDRKGNLLTQDDALRDELIAIGVAVEAESGRLDEPITQAAREVIVDPAPPPRDVWRAAVVLSSATLKFRGKTLPNLVALAPKLRGPVSSEGDRLAQLVGAARLARTWIPFEGECLQRAFLLRSFLASQGYVADWIFGVRTWPFSAHCWLQIGDLVVGDRLERVSRYTPIMRA